jgi:hypothetical protein
VIEQPRAAIDFQVQVQVIVQSLLEAVHMAECSADAGSIDSCVDC